VLASRAARCSAMVTMAPRRWSVEIFVRIARRPHREALTPARFSPPWQQSPSNCKSTQQALAADPAVSLLSRARGPLSAPTGLAREQVITTRSQIPITPIRSCSNRRTWTKPLPYRSWGNPARGRAAVGKDHSTAAVTNLDHLNPSRQAAEAAGSAESAPLAILGKPLACAFAEVGRWRS
jgi:hypothetical protein